MIQTQDISLSHEGVLLHVRDIVASIKFYSALPGATVDGDAQGQFARLKIGDGILNLVEMNTPMRVILEFDSTDVGATYDQLIAAGLRPGFPRRQSRGQTGVRLLDPDGNVIEIGSKSQPAALAKHDSN